MILSKSGMITQGPSPHLVFEGEDTVGAGLGDTGVGNPGERNSGVKSEAWSRSSEDKKSRGDKTLHHWWFLKLSLCRDDDSKLMSLPTLSPCLYPHMQSFLVSRFPRLLQYSQWAISWSPASLAACSSESVLGSVPRQGFLTSGLSDRLGNWQTLRTGKCTFWVYVWQKWSRQEQA